MESNEGSPGKVDNSAEDCNTAQDEESTEKIDEKLETADESTEESTEKIDEKLETADESLANRTDGVEPMIHHEVSRVKSNSKTPATTDYISEAGSSRDNGNEFILRQVPTSSHGGASEIIKSFGHKPKQSKKGFKGNRQRKCIKNNSEFLEIVRKSMSSLSLTPVPPRNSPDPLIKRGETIGCSSASNDVHRFGSPNMNKLQIESTNKNNQEAETNFPKLDWLSNFKNIESFKTTSQRTRKSPISATLLLSPSYSLNQNEIRAEQNPPVRVDQSSFSSKDDTDDTSGTLEPSDSEQSYDRQRAEKAPSTKKRMEYLKSKMNKRRERRTGRTAITHPPEWDIPSCSNVRTELQDKLESSESETNYDLKRMETLEKTGILPDLKEIKRKVKKEKREKSMRRLRNRKHVRSNSGNLAKKGVPRGKGESLETDQSADVSARNLGTSLFHSSSDEQDSKASTTRSHRKRSRPPIVHRSTDSPLLKSNADLLMDVESESSLKTGTFKRRMKKYRTEDNLKKVVDKASNDPEESNNRRKQRKRDLSMVEYFDKGTKDDYPGNKRYKRSRSSEK